MTDQKFHLRLTLINILHGTFGLYATKFLLLIFQKNLKCDKKIIVEAVDSESKIQLRNRKIVKKSYRYVLKDLSYFHLRNQIGILLFLSKTNESVMFSDRFEFQKLLSFSEDKRQVSMSYEYLRGSPLSNELNEECYVQTLTDVLIFLRALRIPDDDINQFFSQRSNRVIYVTSIMLSALILIRNPKYFIKILSVLIFFMRMGFSLLLLEKQQYVISHRDLHDENIVKNENKIGILDPELMVLADPMLDSAIASKYIYRKISMTSYFLFLSKICDTPKNRMRFFLLSISYCLQTLSFDPSNDDGYESTKSYLSFLWGNKNKICLSQK